MGLMAGLGLAILTDIIAALILMTVSMKVAIETFIIAIFLVVGDRIATWASSHIL